MKYNHIKAVEVFASMTLDEVEVLMKALEYCIENGPEGSGVYYRKKILRELNQLRNDAAHTMQLDAELIMKENNDA